MRPQVLGQLVHHLLDLVARHDWAPWATYRNPCCSMFRLRKLQGKKRTPVKRTGVAENRQFIFLANCVRRKSVRNPNAFQRSRCSTKVSMATRLLAVGGRLRLAAAAPAPARRRAAQYRPPNGYPQVS